MTEKFIAPCTEQYGCSTDALELYSRDPGRVDFVKCDSCGIIWRDLSTCNEERIYDEGYFQRMTYDAGREHRIHKAGMLLAILEQFAQRGTILEDGCGPGYNLEAATRRGWKSEGTDISDHVVDFCRKRGINVEKGNLIDNKKIPGSYDAIFLKHVLEHYKDPFLALENAWKLLKPGGHLQIIMPNAEHRKARLLKERYKFYNYDFNGIEHYVYFTRETLKKILEHSGFEQVQENYPLFLKGNNSPKSVLERAVRRSFSVLDMDQELVVVAKKAEQQRGN
jgi:2-polyprenyl-3-methyl-5-hydroxy-6-metoxy-1,4-benzoquinol methylase